MKTLPFSTPAALLALLFAASPALSFADPAHAPMIEVQPSAPQAATGYTVIAPDALQRAVLTSLRNHRPGQSSWVAINLDVGLPTGIRLQAFPYSNGKISVTVEGFVGAMGLTAAYGGGARVQFDVVSGEKNALLISPGMDLYVLPANGGFFGPAQTEYVVGTDADISWLHEFASHFGFELGARVGALTIFGQNGARVLPEVGLFTGVRF